LSGFRKIKPELGYSPDCNTPRVRYEKRRLQKGLIRKNSQSPQVVLKKNCGFSWRFTNYHLVSSRKKLLHKEACLDVIHDVDMQFGRHKNRSIDT